MPYTKYGNLKLGKKNTIINRPTGDSCPPTCPFLGNKCYAEFTETRFVAARKKAIPNMNVSVDKIEDMLLFSIRNRKTIRMHERGDFLKTNGQLDKRYINNWRFAIARIIKRSLQLTSIWTYTHVYREEIAQLSNCGINVYASVHSAKDVRNASKEGFTLFAWASTIRKRHNKETQMQLPILGKTLICPQQTKGITCDKCKWCKEGKGNIVFLRNK